MSKKIKIDGHDYFETRDCAGQLLELVAADAAPPTPDSILRDSLGNKPSASWTTKDLADALKLIMGRMS